MNYWLMNGRGASAASLAPLYPTLPTLRWRYMKRVRTSPEVADRGLVTRRRCCRYHHSRDLVLFLSFLLVPVTFLDLVVIPVHLPSSSSLPSS